jgi:hypothetical protein
MLNNFFNKEKDVKIKFYFDPDQKRMTWDDMNTLEGISNGDVSSTRIMALAARFMADDNNNYLPHEKALKVLGGLNQDDIEDVLKKFTDALTGAAIPNASGEPSNLPSEVGQATGSPDGSQP